MAEPISALERPPHSLIREVSPDAITFYVDELSGLYMPEEFQREHAGSNDVKFWNPEDRLNGKFGRFTVQCAEDIDRGQIDDDKLKDVLLMGTTIGLSGLDRYGDLHSLRHYRFEIAFAEALMKRDLDLETVWLKAADYGHTAITLDEDGKAKGLIISGYSVDYGRANTEGRNKTCELASALLGNTVEVVNRDPEPREHQQIIK